MARKVEKTAMTVEQAIALHMKTIDLSGIGESMNRLLRAAKSLTGNRLLRLADIREVVMRWAEKKWAQITNNYVKPFGRGHLIVNNLARSAAAV